MTKPVLTPPKEERKTDGGQYPPGVFDLVASVHYGRVSLSKQNHPPGRPSPKGTAPREVMRIRLTPEQNKVPLTVLCAKMEKEIAALQAAEDKRNGITRKTPPTA
jgi:hypothetical protein